MNFWLNLTNEDQLQELDEKSFHQSVIIFKHSTSCSISQIIKYRFEKHWPSNSSIYLLDIFSFRTISNKIEEMYQVRHESPQILVIKNGKCIFDESHLDIDTEEVNSYLSGGTISLTL